MDARQRAERVEINRKATVSLARVSLDSSRLDRSRYTERLPACPQESTSYPRYFEYILNANALYHKYTRGHLTQHDESLIRGIVQY